MGPSLKDLVLFVLQLVLSCFEEVSQFLLGEMGLALVLYLLNEVLANLKVVVTLCRSSAKSVKGSG